MEINQHLMEPWLMKNQFIKYNLGNSGVEDQTLESILSQTNTDVSELMQISLCDNDTYGSIELRKTIASLYEGVHYNNIMVTTGTSEAIFLYFATKFKKNANVIIPVPAFQTLSEVPYYLGFEVRYLKLKKENGFRINANELEELIDQNTAILVLNNPHNPTGVRLSNSEIEEIKLITEKYNIEVLIDEHYRFISYDPFEDVISSLLSNFKKATAVGSMIKCFGCVGLRVGWMIGNVELLEASRNLKDYTTHTLCSINDYISQKVLLNSNKISNIYKGWITENKATFTDFINRNNNILDWVKPEAGIVAFPYFKNISNCTSIIQMLIDQKEVFLLPGETFEEPNHFRICLGLEPKKFSEAIKRFQDFLSENGAVLI